MTADEIVAFYGPPRTVLYNQTTDVFGQLASVPGFFNLPPSLPCSDMSPAEGGSPTKASTLPSRIPGYPPTPATEAQRQSSLFATGAHSKDNSDQWPKGW